MLFPITLLLLLSITCQTPPVQSRSYFRGISSDEMDTSASDESKPKNKTFGGYLRNYPYSQQRRAEGPSSYMILGLGQNGRLFRIPDAETKETTTASIFANRRPAASSPNKCGMVPQFTSDMGSNFNSSFVSNGQIPWQAAVFSADGQFLCSGVLVSPKHVLTAALCLLTLEYVKTPHLLEVRVGAWDLRGMVSSSEEHNYYFTSSPSQIHLYPEMNIADTTDIKTSKIALLELKEKVNMTKHGNIRPICLESLALPSLQDRTQHESLSETSASSTNVIDDKKTDGHGKRGRKDFMVKKKSQHQSTGKKPAFHRSTGTKVKVMSTNALECYVSGWGSRSQSSVNYLTKKMQKHDIEERAAITSLTLPIIPGGKYIVHSDSSSPKETSDEVTAWEFKSTSNEGTTTKQETNTNASDSDTELATILQDILTSSSSNTKSPSVPNLDPIEDYLDSFELGSRITSSKVDSSKATQSKSRKKQLKPDKEFRDSLSAKLPTFDPIESDELLVDKQDEDEEERRGGLLSSRHNLRLRWALVTMHNISNAEHVDLGLGTSYLKAVRSKDPDALCMVDIGSPIICRKRSSVLHAKPSNIHKVLAGIVTWKLPCFSPKESDDIALAMNDLETNYNLVQITPIMEILDFIAERVKESETDVASSTAQATGTEPAVGV